MKMCGAILVSLPLGLYTSTPTLSLDTVLHLAFHGKRPDGSYNLNKFLLEYTDKILRFSSNLIHALRNFSIRGEFRTNVEYLIEILETEDYIKNVFHTAWLDRIISHRSENHKSNYIMGIYAGAVHIARRKFTKDLLHIEDALLK